MRKTMRWISTALAGAVIGGMLLGLPPAASAQRAMGRVVVVAPVVAPVPVFDPFFPYAYYPYGYPAWYVAGNYGYVKVNTHGQQASVYVDGGYAAKTHKSKKLALKAGNHNIELKDSNGKTFFQERVAVTVGQTTKVDVPS
jgi:PEGA domain